MMLRVKAYLGWGLWLLMIGTLSGFAAGTIPSSRTCIEGWHNAGYPGEIPAPDKIVNVRDYGAVGDGTTDDYNAIVAARNALGGAGVVYFPAGTYKCNSSIVLTSNGQVIRGQRAVSTKLLFNIPAVMETSHSIKISGGGAGAWQAMTAGYAWGSKTITVTDGSVFSTGEYAQTRQVNDPSWNLPTPGWQDYACGQIVRIQAVTGHVISLETPLRFDYQGSQSPEIRPINAMRKSCGVENITVQQVSNGVTSARDNVCTIFFYLAAGGWVRGVIGLDAFGGHVGAQESTQIEVTGCYFDNAIDHDGGGSGYGVRLEYKTGEILTENNIFTKMRHSMLVQAGANGNVFGYNYSLSPIKDGTELSASDIVLHGTYPYANLFEGNLVNFINPDNSHAANGPMNTFFRNRAIYHGIRFTDPLIRDANIVGNECRSDGATTAIMRSILGDGYEIPGSNHFAYANATPFDGNPVPTGYTNLPDYSYYLNEDPAVPPLLPNWWTSGTDIRVMGPVDPADMPINLTGAVTQPAKARYDAAGILTVGVPSIARQPTNATVASGSAVTFAVEAYGNANTRYQWYQETQLMAGATASNLTINPALSANTGRYYCVITDDEGSVSSATGTLEVLVQNHNITISWTPAAAGTVNPSGTISVIQGGTTSFVIQAAAFYEIGNVRTNGMAVENIPVTNAWELIWSNISSTGEVQVTFASKETSQGTPWVWLASNGLLGVDDPVQAEEAEGDDPDADGATTGDEFRAGTQPTNAQSVLNIDGLTPAALTEGVLVWRSVNSKRYDILATTNLAVEFSVLQSNLTATALTHSVQVPITNSPIFFRVRLAE